MGLERGGRGRYTCVSGRRGLGGFSGIYFRRVGRTRTNFQNKEGKQKVERRGRGGAPRGKR